MVKPQSRHTLESRLLVAVLLIAIFRRTRQELMKFSAAPKQKNAVIFPYGGKIAKPTQIKPTSNINVASDVGDVICLSNSLMARDVA
jgi:hypothetical protein